MLDCLQCLPWSTIWAFVSAIAAVAVALIAANELSKSRSISNAQFIQDFKKDFFNPINTELYMLFEFNMIKYYPDNKGINRLNDIPEDFLYFKVTMPGFKRKPHDIPSYFKGIDDVYSGYEIDDYILGHFEDLGLFEQKGIMSLDAIDSVFGTYILLIGDNEEIQKYITDIREEYKDPKLYSNFEALYNKLRKK